MLPARVGSGIHCYHRTTNGGLVAKREGRSAQIKAKRALYLSITYLPTLKHTYRYGECGALFSLPKT